MAGIQYNPLGPPFDYVGASGDEEITFPSTGFLIYDDTDGKLYRYTSRNGSWYSEEVVSTTGTPIGLLLALTREI